MKIGFFTVFRKDPQHYALAVRLIESVRTVMPTVPIVQFTDENSPPVLGVDAVVRRPHGRMLEIRLEHYAAADGDWLLLDTDTLVKQDVQGVFEEREFDIAIADRDWTHLPQSLPVMHTMPFNTGVVFSRCPRFWDAVLQQWRFEEEKDWLSEQRAVWQVIRTGHFRVKILPGMTYNYPPQSAQDPCKGVAIAHYKGPRKDWMR